MIPYYSNETCFLRSSLVFRFTAVLGATLRKLIWFKRVSSSGILNTIQFLSIAVAIAIGLARASGQDLTVL
ncbi:hypothetical protein O181_129841, partial [Austropuccinia psidii MF-1]|nr:hypothetical protein [Austropuccinia psidii MF-1]